MVALISSADRAGLDLRDDAEFTIAPPTQPGVTFMPIIGTDGDDTLNILVDTTSVDAGAGDDTVTYSLDLSAGPASEVETIDGGEGFDTLDLSGLVLGTEDLRALDPDFDVIVDFFSGGDLVLPDDGFAAITGLLGLEAVVGSQYNDLIDGADALQIIDGGAGDDFLLSDLADTVLIGGAGADILESFSADGGTASYETAEAGVRVSLSDNASFGTGDAEGDVFIGIDTVIGSDFSDIFQGSDGDDTFIGGAGNDRLFGGDGADTFDGGEGRDLVIYSRSSEGINVNLATGRSLGGQAEGDTLINVEAVQGSQFRDIIRGDDSNNLLSGLGGNDTLFGGAGNDSLVGGAGRDVLFGGEGSDFLGGGTGNDVLRGDAGADRLAGGEGNDLLIGGAGPDTLQGGDGFDTADYRSATAAVTVNLSNSRMQSGDATGDTFSSVERILASSFDDSVTGGATGDILVGLDGNDTLMGMGGNDSLSGGAGDDTLQGGDGRDFLTGGAGNDTFVVAAADTGRSTVLDFEDGDVIDLSDLGENFDTFAEVQAAARNAASTVVIFLGNSSLQLLDMQVEDLTADMFDFGAEAVA